nr:hypothetical protein StreXyl84_77450 [Streptomyces sp. Xyl84]
MAGGADAGTKVRVRCLPHHDHEIEVFDATTGKHLGTAHLADAATDEQRRALRRSKGRREAASGSRAGPGLAAYPPEVRGGDPGRTAQTPGALTSAEADQP